MGQTTGELEARVEETRANLDANLQELEEKVKAAADWRQHYQRTPGAMLSLAFGGGVLLAAVAGGRRNGRLGSRLANHPRFRDEAGNCGRGETWNTLKSAALGVVATRVKDYLSHILPGR